MAKAKATEEVEEVSVQWVDPPASKRGTRVSKYQPIIEAVKERPNEWALVMEDVNAASAKVFTTNGLRITTRSTGNSDGKVNVWAMYVVDDDTEADGEVEVTSKPRKPVRKRPAKRNASE